MTERRFSDDEIAEILKRATSTRSLPPPQRGATDGLTLEELHQIGNEVGIPAEALTHAAMTLESTLPVQEQKLLGLPIVVRESVQLSRRLSKTEWEQMVVAARSTFAARGRLHSVGDFHEWTNGNLAMLLEPTAEGHQLRFQTRHQSVEGMFRAGVILTGSGTVMSALGFWTSASGTAAFSGTGLFLLGVGALILGVAAGLLPRWARERREQMQSLLAKARAMVLVPIADNRPGDLPTLPSA